MSTQDAYLKPLKDRPHGWSVEQLETLVKLYEESKGSDWVISLKRIREIFPWLTYIGVQYRLKRLVEKGVLTRLAHGTYMLTKEGRRIAEEYLNSGGVAEETP